MTKPRQPISDPNAPDRVTKQTNDGNGSTGNTDDTQRGRESTPHKR